MRVGLVRGIVPETSGTGARQPIKRGEILPHNTRLHLVIGGVGELGSGLLATLVLLACVAAPKRHQRACLSVVVTGGRGIAGRYEQVSAAASFTHLCNRVAVFSVSLRASILSFAR